MSKKIPMPYVGGAIASKISLKKKDLPESITDEKVSVVVKTENENQPQFAAVKPLRQQTKSERALIKMLTRPSSAKLKVEKNSSPLQEKESSVKNLSVYEGKYSAEGKRSDRHDGVEKDKPGQTVTENKEITSQKQGGNLDIGDGKAHMSRTTFKPVGLNLNKWAAVGSSTAIKEVADSEN